MVLKLYNVDGSPPCRAVRVVAKTLGLTIEKKDVDLPNLEHMTPEFLAINPNHTVPVLDDDGFILVDSHAICAYLVNVYGKEDSLYPKDLKKRAKIDEVLHFDSGTLFARAYFTTHDIWIGKTNKIDPERVKSVEEAYKVVEHYLNDQEWLAGSKPTLADFSVYESIDYISLVAPIDGYPKLSKWFDRVGKLPHVEEINKGMKELIASMFREKGVKI